MSVPNHSAELNLIPAPVIVDHDAIVIGNIFGRETFSIPTLKDAWLQNASAKTKQIFDSHFRSAVASLKLDLPKAKDNVEAEVVLTRFVNNVELAFRAVDVGIYIAVKIGVGKTALSRKATVEVKHPSSDHPECEIKTISSTFMVPASQVIGVGKITLIPRWICLQNLKQVQKRARYANQKFERIPVARSQWIGKADLLAALVQQLPVDGAALLAEQQALFTQRALERELRSTQMREKAKQ